MQEVGRDGDSVDVVVGIMAMVTAADFIAAASIMLSTATCIMSPSAVAPVAGGGDLERVVRFGMGLIMN